MAATKTQTLAKMTVIIIVVVVIHERLASQVSLAAATEAAQLRAAAEDKLIGPIHAIGLDAGRSLFHRSDWL